MSAKNRQTIRLPSVPNEIWAVILQYATATDLLDLDFLLRVGTSWRPSVQTQSRILKRSFKTKKCIIRICKAWRDIGTPLLWKIICVTDTNVDLLTSQLLYSKLLAITAGDPALCLGWWTKHLYIDILEFRNDQSLAQAISCFPNLLILTLLTNYYDANLISPWGPPWPERSPCMEAVCQSCPALEFVNWDMYDSEMFHHDWYRVHTTAARNLRAIRFLDRDLLPGPPQLELSPTITTVVYGMAMTVETARSLRDCQHFIVDFASSPAGWLPLLRSLGKTITTFTLPVIGWHLQDALSAVTESCPNFRKLIISFGSWVYFRSDCRFPPTMTILDIRSDQLQGRDVYYKHLIAALGSMTAEGLQTVQLVDGRNCNDMRQHSKIMHLARAELAEKKWSILDDEGGLFLHGRN